MKINSFHTRAKYIIDNRHLVMDPGILNLGSGYLESTREMCWAQIEQGLILTFFPYFCHFLMVFWSNISKILGKNEKIELHSKRPQLKVPWVGWRFFSFFPNIFAIFDQKTIKYGKKMKKNGNINSRSSFTQHISRVDSRVLDTYLKPSLIMDMIYTLYYLSNDRSRNYSMKFRDKGLAQHFWQFFMQMTPPVNKEKFTLDSFSF